MDAAISRILEVLFAFPGLLLALLLFAVYGGSVTTAIFAVGIATAPGYARLIRAQALAVRSSPYVEASRALGHSPARIVRRTIFPNAMRPLVALTMMGIGQSIVWVSSLSFLGLGAQPPAPEWGSMLAQGRDYVSTAWWLALFPGLAIVTATVAFTVLGRYLQQRAEGRLDVSVADELLAVDDLRVAFGRGPELREVVAGISFTLRAGECLAIVGESGSGKSVTARTLVGLTGEGARVTARRLQHRGRDLMGLGDRQWRSIRGRDVGFVLQDALVSLDPLRTVGAEIAEALRLHGQGGRRDRERRVLELLEQVGVPEPELRARQRPHELSGGLRQRALIASAIALDPPLVIADEPTTALDATVQAQVLRVLEDMTARGAALLVISHDLAVVGRLADRVAVMHDGRIVEQGPIEHVLGAPRHPYTRALLQAVPSFHGKGTRLAPASAVRAIPARAAASSAAAPAGPVLQAEGLVKSYRGPDGVDRTVVQDVSFRLERGETLGIVGESGSGKTTTARIVLGLVAPDAGTVLLDGQPWSELRERDRRPQRHRIATIYQDPLSSFDPRWTVERILRDAVATSRGLEGRAVDAVVDDLLDQVGLARELRERRPLLLSGGQRQRVAIARALAPEPEVIVCDEPVSALDVSIQAQILDLLADLQEAHRLGYLFISHDLGVVHHVSDRVLVMQDGRVVEEGDAEALFRAPDHPYTRELLGALPELPALAAAR